MANFCEHCGATLTAGVRFCEACGQPITSIVEQTSRRQSPTSSSPKSIRPAPSRKMKNIFIAGGLAVGLMALIIVGVLWWQGQSPAKKFVIAQKEVPAQKSAPSSTAQPPAPKPQAEPTMPQPPAEPKTATGSFSLDEEAPSPAPAQPTYTPQPAAPQSQRAWGGSWPWTSGRLIREDELRPLSFRDLELMRNEIYARHGWVFHRQDLRDHFGRQPWYRPMGDMSNWEQTNRRVQAELTAIEKKNIQTIVSREKALK